MATATFSIPQNLISKLNLSLSATSEILNEVLHANAKVICEALVAFHDDGSPIVNEFELDKHKLSYDSTKGTGKLMFRYMVNYTFGCSDLSPSEKATERCNFEIVGDQLSVHIHDPIRRDTFDEF